jgi:hypothetical protein
LADYAAKPHQLWLRLACQRSTRTYLDAFSVAHLSEANSSASVPRLAQTITTVQYFCLAAPFPSNSRCTPQPFCSTPAPTDSHISTYLQHPKSSHKGASDSDACLRPCPFIGLGRFHSPAQSKQQGPTRTSVLWYAELANASVSRSICSYYGLIGGRASAHVSSKCRSLCKLKLNLHDLHSIAFSSSSINVVNGSGVYMKPTSLSVALV